MGTSDGAEVCELIGISMLDTSSPEAEKLKKKFQKLFKEKIQTLLFNVT